MLEDSRPFLNVLAFLQPLVPLLLRDASTVSRNRGEDLGGGGVAVTSPYLPSFFVIISRKGCAKKVPTGPVIAKDANKDKLCKPEQQHQAREGQARFSSQFQSRPAALHH